MTVQDATFYLLKQLRAIYNESETSQVADWVMEKITGSAKVERMLYKNAALAGDEETQLRTYTERLLRHEPVQYVLNESWFYGLKFYVDKNVLIPRPETEELVKWIIDTYKPAGDLKILDIGSGSGCIAVALKKNMQEADVWACDTSQAALEIAKRNAAAVDTAINFIELDFLDRSKWEQLTHFDIIVSNPPYVPEMDKEQMQPNVWHYEPGTALFVPDADPLIFYEAMAEFGKTHLTRNGSIYAEIHENFGKDTCDLFQLAGYTTELKTDMQGKERMIKSIPGI